MISLNGQNLLIEIEFVIFDKINPLTPCQKEIKEKLFDGHDFKNIIKQAIQDLPYCQFLKTREPAISCQNGQMQLRLHSGPIHRIFPQYQHSFYFYQKCSNKYFTKGQLTEISKKIQIQLEQYLGYQIDTNLIVYMDIDDLQYKFYLSQNLENKCWRNNTVLKSGLCSPSNAESPK